MDNKEKENIRALIAKAIENDGGFEVILEAIRKRSEIVYTVAMRNEPAGKAIVVQELCQEVIVSTVKRAVDAGLLEGRFDVLAGSNLKAR